MADWRLSSTPPVGKSASGIWSTEPPGVMLHRFTDASTVTLLSWPKGMAVGISKPQPLVPGTCCEDEYVTFVVPVFSSTANAGTAEPAASAAAQAPASRILPMLRFVLILMLHFLSLACPRACTLLASGAGSSPDPCLCGHALSRG